MSEIFSSFQLLFFYLDNHSKKSDEEKISDILKPIQDYLNISKQFKEFFEKEGNQFKINQMMNIFLYIEHLFFHEILENLDKEFKKEISKEKKEKISILINIEDKIRLSKALRRYISRYLVNKNLEKRVKNELALELRKPDLWGVDENKINEIYKILSEELKQVDLRVEESFDLYNIIGKKDMEFVEKIKTKEKSDDEGNISSDNPKKNRYNTTKIKKNHMMRMTFEK